MKWYYINAASEKIGPLSSKVLKSLAEKGEIQRQTIIFSEDGRKSEAGKVRGLFSESEKKNAGVPVSASANPTSPQQPVSPQPVTPTLVTSTPQNDPFATFAFQLPPKPENSYDIGGTLAVIFGLLAGIGILVTASAFFIIPKFVGNPPSDVAQEQTLKTELNSYSEEKNIQDNQNDQDNRNKPADSVTKPVDAVQPVLPPRNPVAKLSPDRFETAPTSRNEHRELRSTEEIIAAVESSVALVSGETSSGSGFVVLPGIIATNSHVINSEPIDKLEVVFPSVHGTKNAGPFPVKLLYEDVDRDLAFLEISSKTQRPLDIVQNYKFRRGQKVVVIGNPGKGDGTVLENAVCEGILSTQTEVDQQPYYQLSIAVNAGNSGGPALDETGRVLGVVTLKAVKTEAIAYCIPPDDFLQALEEVKHVTAAKIRSAEEQHAARVPLFRGLEKLSLFKQIPETTLTKFVEETLADFEEAVKNTPKEPLAFLGRGACKSILDNPEGALQDFEQMVLLAPDKQEFIALRDLARKEFEQQKQNMAHPGIFLRRDFSSHFSAPPMFPSPKVVPPRPTPRIVTPRTLVTPRIIVPPPITLERQPRFGVPPSGVFPQQPSAPAQRSSLPPPKNAEEMKERLARHQQILEKEEWTFDGEPMYGRIISYRNGTATFRLKEPENNSRLAKRDVKKFSKKDIEDIRFFAEFRGITYND